MKFNLKNLQWRSAGIASLFTLALYPILFLICHEWLMAGLLSGMAGAGANKLREKYVRSLLARIDADSGPAWDVEINDVRVGSIKDSEYAAVRLQVFSDVRNYVAQLLNFGKVTARAFDYCYLGIPLALFWIMIALAVFSPESYSAIVSEFQKAGPAEITSAVKVGAQLLGGLMIIIVSMHLMLGLSRFGFINRFAEATASIVRKRCGVPAEGEMTLVRWVDGSPQFNDEMVYVRINQADRKNRRN